MEDLRYELYKHRNSAWLLTWTIYPCGSALAGTQFSYLVGLSDYTRIGVGWRRSCLEPAEGHAARRVWF